MALTCACGSSRSPGRTGPAPTPTEVTVQMVSAAASSTATGDHLDVQAEELHALGEGPLVGEIPSHTVSRRPVMSS